MSKGERMSFIVGISSKVLENCGVVTDALLKEKVVNTMDGVHNYSRVLCHYLALTLEFTDARAEGDGERIIRCWRIFLLHFHVNGRTKYALEAVSASNPQPFPCTPINMGKVYKYSWRNRQKYPTRLVQ